MATHKQKLLFAFESVKEKEDFHKFAFNKKKTTMHNLIREALEAKYPEFFNKKKNKSK